MAHANAAVVAADCPLRELLRHELVHLFEVDIGPLLDRGYFFSEEHQHRCYALAGGFTSFLIRRFGWDSYREFYRKADCRTFRARFEKRFGMNLERAWRRWRDEAVAMEALGRRLREERLFN